jgi:hypothetical protein
MIAEQDHPPPLLSGGMKLMTATEITVPKVITSAMIIIAMNIFLFLLFSRIFKGIFETFLIS